MIETRLLRNALMLAKHRNFARAAKELHISQPTLTRSIQLLEKTVGERLFDRTTRTILPTKAGEIVLKHASIIIASTRAMQEDVGRHRGLSDGSLFIGTGPYAGIEEIAPVIGQFSRLYPEIRIEVRVGDWRKLPGQWGQEDFDFMVIETSELDESLGFDVTRLTRHPAFFFCRQNHPLLKKDSLSISDLASFPLIGPALPERIKGPLRRLFSSSRTASSPPKTLQKYICNDLGTIKAILHESDSIGVGTYGIAVPELESGLFKALPFRIPALTTHLSIVKRKGLSLSHSARTFIKILIELDNELSHSEAKLIRSLGPEIST